MSNNKLSAEELEREIKYIQETGANSIRYYELFDKFATQRLEAYKAEQKQRLELIDRYAHEIMMDNDQWRESDEYINGGKIREQVHYLTKKESDGENQN